MLASCSGGSPNAGGGIGGSGIISRGAISALGSLTVNGTEFDTRGAALIIGGEAVGVGDDVLRAFLDVGRVVTVEGFMDEAGGSFAERVFYRSEVSGPVGRITEIDSQTKVLADSGQTVMANTLTVFKGTALDTLARDDEVEVSGFYDDMGVIWATFLERSGPFAPDSPVEVTGTISNLDTVKKTFTLNALEVDYAQADTTALPGGAPREGLRVEAEGTLDEAGIEMRALRIAVADEVDALEADQIEVTGFVTDYASPFAFSLGSQPVQASADTLFVDGTAGDIAPGVKLEAEGTLVGGILLAWEIEFWEADQVELEGHVEAVYSPTAFSISGQRVQTDADTVFEDGLAQDIVPGVKVEIKGTLIGEVLFADKVSFEEE
jgi:hypothetical protein